MTLSNFPLNKVQSDFPVDVAQLQAMVVGFSGIVFLVDSHRRILWGNKEAYTLSTDIVGKYCSDVLRIDIEDCGKCIVANSIKTGELRKGIRKGVPECAEGSRFVAYEITSSPVYRGEVVDGAMVMVVNITERFQIEKRLRHTQKMEAVGTLARGVAHDFNNVLTPIIGYSEIIRLKMNQDGAKDSAIDAYLQEILAASKRAQSLVDQILRCSSNAQSNTTIIHVQKILEETAGIMETMLPATIKIRTQIDKNCGRICIDESHLQQILMNLCHNSADAIGNEHGSLCLSLSSLPMDVTGKKWLKISVEDSGCGIEQSLIERVFEPYFTTQEKECGKGMGLAVVHGLVHSQGGYVRIGSEVGVGTIFSVYFPVADTVVSPEQVAKIPGLTMGQGNVLFVDDDEQIVEVGTQLLQTLGYEVTGFSSPRKALAHFIEDPECYEVLITDLTMPDLTGVELCAQMKKIAPDLPVILCTGYSERLTADVLHEVGVSRYCLKPLALNEFATVIAEVMKKS